MGTVGKWWGLFSREELEESMYGLERTPGSPVEGIFFLPPPVLELTFYKDLWDQIDERTGLFFDLGEEEWIAPKNVAGITEVINTFVRQYKGSSLVLSRIVSRSFTAGVFKDIRATMSYKEIIHWLKELCVFLNEEAAKNKTVIAVF